MTLIERIASWWRKYPRLADGLIIVPLLLVILFMSTSAMTSMTFPMLVYGWSDEALIAISLVIMVCHMAPWIFRRTNPVASAVVVVVGSLVHLVIGPEFIVTMFMVPLTVQNLAHLAPRWASLAGFVTALVGAALYALSLTMRTHFWGIGSRDIVEASGLPYALPIGIPVAAMVVLFWTLGKVQRARRVQLQNLQTRTEQLTVEARQERELAAADERNRIARELHDIVAHSLQVIISQADGARYASATDPDVAPRTLGTIADTGRDALGQMRRLLGVLRDTDVAALAPQPGLTNIAELIETMQRSGVDVSLYETGKRARDLADGAELVLYRIIQEALTNVARHAGATARTTVTLHWRANAVSVTVEDDGGGKPARDPAQSGGQGLIGMRERVALYEGSFAAGSRAAGGFRVHVQLPYREN